MNFTAVSVAGIIILVFILGMLLLVKVMVPSEDDWIKNSKGVYVKHGNPALTPVYVREQQDAINCSSELYQQKKNSFLNFSSQCLGDCNDYSIDIVHVPRTDEDNKQENQCSSYLQGKTSRFIELDKNGEIQKIFN